MIHSPLSTLKTAWKLKMIFAGCFFTFLSSLCIAQTMQMHLEIYTNRKRNEKHKHKQKILFFHFFHHCKLQFLKTWNMSFEDFMHVHVDESEKILFFCLSCTSLPVCAEMMKFCKRKRRKRRKHQKDRWGNFLQRKNKLLLKEN